jgi:transketolase
MKEDPSIWVICVDLGYKMFDKIRDDFPDRWINTGASEQAAAGIAVGLALQGKKPFIYSITPFLLFRAFETWRLYANHEQIPIRLVGGGRDDDYKHDGFSHYAGDDRIFVNAFPNIGFMEPTDKAAIPYMVNQMVKENKPVYINLRR